MSDLDSPVNEEVVEAVPGEDLSENQSDSDTTTDEVVGQTTEDDKDDVAKEPGADDEPKRKSGFERRVQKLNSKLEAASREAEYWKQAALGQGPKTTTAAPAPASQDKPKFDDYLDIEAYADALTDWKLERAEAKRTQQSQVQNVQQTYGQKLQAFKADHPDFDEVMEDADEDVTFAQATLQTIQESDIGPEVAYFLAKNPESAERISKLSIASQIKEIGKLEERLSKKQADAPAPAKKVSAAPAPIKPTTAKASVKSADLSDPNLSVADFNRIRAEQIKARRSK